jgi:hypothetical protein
MQMGTVEFNTEDEVYSDQEALTALTFVEFGRDAAAA